MIHPEHYQEWLDSAIAPSLIELNLESLNGEMAAESLFYSDKLPRRNTGRLSDGFLKRYDHLESGGWWCGTLDPHTGEPSLWGCFKPNRPKMDLEKRKPIKYEHPPKVETEAFFLRVSHLVVWKIVRSLENEEIYREWVQRLCRTIYPFLEETEEVLQILETPEGAQPRPNLIHRVHSPENSRKSGQSPSLRTLYQALERGERREIDRLFHSIWVESPHNPTQLEQIDQGGNTRFVNREDRDFWPWVLAHPSIPITITEGAKKAGSLLTTGKVAIALPGIWNGYRKIPDPHLIPQLELLATGGREVVFCFDQDKKPKTVEAVEKAIIKTGNLFEKRGCRVKVITWSYPEKGVDDVIAEWGEDCFTLVYAGRQHLEDFRLRSLTDLNPYIDLTVRLIEKGID
jgi:hypothetical protein